MPIDIETFESSSEDRLQNSGETNADRVMRFLAAHPDQAFTQSEIRDATGVKAGSISVVLSRLEDRGHVRHKGTYWAVGETDDVPPRATVTIKEINDNRYYYWQWREGDQVKSKYDGPVDPDE